MYLGSIAALLRGETLVKNGCRMPLGEVIIAYALDLKLQQKFILKHAILYVHCVDLLMWSPTKLDFPFYDFFRDLL